MNNDTNFSRAISIISEQNNLVICLPINYTLDTIGAATSLYLGLNKLGKNVLLTCGQEISLETNLVGVDKIQKQLTASGDTLLISFPYIEGAVDKVSYNIEGDWFNLVIQPQPGQPKLDPSKVKYSYTGGKIDVIITVDTPTLNSLGDLYLKNEDQFRGNEIINIDRHLTNSSFGTVNLVNRQSSSTSEIILKLLQYLQVEIDKDMATNLYAGIISATNNFTAYSVAPETFEVSAQLLRLGASRKPVYQMKMEGVSPVIRSHFVSQPAEGQILANETLEKKEKKIGEAVSKDWLKPKVFHGKSLI